MKIDSAQIVAVQYTGVARALKPIVFKEGDSYCCLLGPDPVRGVMGRGDSPVEALQDWDKHLQEHLRSAVSRDLIAQQVMDIVNADSQCEAQICL